MEVYNYSGEEEVRTNKQPMSKKKKIILAIAAAVVITAVIISVVITTITKKNNVAFGYVGDTMVNRDKVEFTLVAVDNAKTLTNGAWTTTTENNYVVLTIKITNKSDDEISFFESGISLYKGNSKYNRVSSLYVSGSDVFFELGSGLSKTFKIAFETPASTQVELYMVEMGYSLYSSGSELVTFKLK